MAEDRRHESKGSDHDQGNEVWKVHVMVRHSEWAATTHNGIFATNPKLYAELLLGVHLVISEQSHGADAPNCAWGCSLRRQPCFIAKTCDHVIR